MGANKRKTSKIRSLKSIRAGYDQAMGLEVKVSLNLAQIADAVSDLMGIFGPRTTQATSPWLATSKAGGAHYSV